MRWLKLKKKNIGKMISRVHLVFECFINTSYVLWIKNWSSNMANKENSLKIPSHINSLLLNIASNFRRTKFSMFLLTRNSIPSRRVLNHSLLFVLWPYVLSKRWCITRNINPLSIILPTRNTLGVNFVAGEKVFALILWTFCIVLGAAKRIIQKHNERRQFND